MQALKEMNFIFMKQITDKHVAKKLTLNLARIRRKLNYDKLRIAQDKQGNVYFFGYQKDSQLFDVFYGENLDVCGHLHFNLKEQNNEKIAELGIIKLRLEYRGRGIGSQLMKFFESEVKKEGATKISCDTNDRGRDVIWLEKLGYKQVTDFQLTSNIFEKDNLEYSSGMINLGQVIDDKTKTEIMAGRIKMLDFRNKAEKMAIELNKTCD